MRTQRLLQEFYWCAMGTFVKANSQVLLENLNRNTKAAVVADGSGNQDKEALANETWDVGHVLFSKTGHQEKVKPGKAMPDLGYRQVWLPKSPHAPQATLRPMFISRTICANLIPKHE